MHRVTTGKTVSSVPFFGVFAVPALRQHLHTGLFVGADDQLAGRVWDGCPDVQLANVLSLGVENGVVTVEPVDAAMRLEVGVVPDTR